MLIPSVQTTCASIRPVRLLKTLCLVLLAGGCVPNGPPTSTENQGTANASGKQSDPTPAASAPRKASTSPPLTEVFEDDFERESLGSAWNATAPVWKIENGQLCGKGARNRPVWLARSLPTNVRIEFDATSDSPDGDLKAEIFGDGRSAARGVSYNDATSYLAIFGGWKNSYHVLARRNEHASDRPEIRIEPGSDDERARPVVPGQTYRFKLERADGKTLKWWVDDVLMFSFKDPDPLTGPGHDHFGFNDWDVRVCFDNVKITPL